MKVNITTIKDYKGKEYNQEGIIVFEGKYLYNKRWNGKGKEYNNSEDKLKFEGYIKMVKDIEEKNIMKKVNSYLKGNI